MGARQVGPARSRLAEELRRAIGHERGDQQRVADSLGITRSSVSRWVAGSSIPSYESLNRIAGLLRMPDARVLFALHESALVERERAADRATTTHAAGAGEIDGTAVGVVRLLVSRDEVYAAAASVIETAIRDDVTTRTLDWASIHGMGGTREDDVNRPSSVPSPVRRFDRVVQRVLSRRPPLRRWHLRQVLNVDSEYALKRVLTRLQDREGCAADYEVWAYSATDAPPVLSPLIVSGRWVFVAPEDNRTYRAGSGLYIDDEHVGTWARLYFEQIVANAEFRLRSAGGIDRHAVSALRSRLSPDRS